MTYGESDMDALLESYLDGALTDEQREAFERARREQPELNLDVDRQRAIDTSIRRQFERRSSWTANGKLAGPAPAPLPAPLPMNGGRQRRIIWRAAAAIILVPLLGWLAWIGYQASPLSRTAAERLYHSSPVIAWVCKNDQEFQEQFDRRLGQPLSMPSPPDDVKVAGIGYVTTLSNYTAVIISTVDDRDAYVLVDLVANDTEMTVRPSSELHLFRRQIGKLVLYEVTPLDQSRLLDLIQPVPPKESPSMMQPSQG